MNHNIDAKVVEGFGREWKSFNQNGLSEANLIEMFNSYFDIFPWKSLPKDAVGFDLGCGSGRWAKIVAPKVGTLHCIDPSALALEVAKENLTDCLNCYFHQASVDSIPLPDDSTDFGYALGVLHHIPNTEEGIRCCVTKLKNGAPFLLYLYYSLDNRPFWFRAIWKLSNVGRLVISQLPYPIKYALSQLIALCVYLPLSRFSLIMEKFGMSVSSFPLASYRKRSFYVMRTDALDRFGTRLEKRFSQEAIRRMMENAGLENIVFSQHAPYWCAVGYKKKG